MPTQHSILSYAYGELSETAKTNALDWFRETLDDDWYEPTFATIRDAGALLGIEIDHVSFSGFWSQGDGASITGAYRYRPDAVEAILAEFPTDETLVTIARALHAAGQGAHATIERPDRGARYVHEHSVSIHANDDAEHAVLCPALREFMRWAYRLLEADYKDAISDAACLEYCHANDHRFAADGRAWAEFEHLITETHA